MSSVCKSSVGCVDAREPVRASFVNLYKWPESDAEFVRSVTSPTSGNVDGGWRWGPRPRVVDGYSCRQMYLRSYTFSKKESFPEKTQRCFGRVRERAAVCPFLRRRSVSVDSVRSNGSQKDEKIKERRRKGNKEKGCAAAKKLLDFILRRLLSCTSSVDVVDRSSPPYLA